MAKIVEFKEIALRNLVIGTAQVRTRDVGKGIDELADSIRVNGLLEPILVAPTQQEGKYEIILGQRRFLAHQVLHEDTIMTGVLDEPIDEITAKVLSVTENLIRQDLNRTDLIDVCTYLYKKYGTITAVIEQTGLPYNRVKDYVKYDRLMPELKTLVDQGEVDLNAALRAQNAAEAVEEPTAEDAVKLAKEMTHMGTAQRQRVERQVVQNPALTVDQAIEDAKGSGRVIQTIITLGQEAHKSLGSFAQDEGTTLDDAATSLIEEALQTRGYM